MTRTKIITRIFISVILMISVSFCLYPKDASAFTIAPEPPEPHKFIYYSPADNTIYIIPQKNQKMTTVTLPDIAKAINNESVLRQESPKVWLLSANIWLKGKSSDKGKVTLLFSRKTVTWLKIKSNPSDFVWIKVYNGNLLIGDTKITSWDFKNKKVDKNYEDGRSFILAKYNSRMDIINSEIAYLGYKNGESYGVSWRIPKGSLGKYLVTGRVWKSDFHHNYYGAYTYGAQKMKFVRNRFHDNVEYGLDPHDDSNGFLVINNYFFRNGKHGLIFSKRCVNNTIIGNVFRNNALSGMMLDKQSNNNTVKNNISFGNVNGIAIYESNGNKIESNRIYNNQRGILAKDGAAHNTIKKNRIYRNSQYGVYFYNEASDNAIEDNNIYDNGKNGIYIKSHHNIIGPHNFIYDNKNAGIYFYEKGAYGNEVKENIIYRNGVDGVIIKDARENTIDSNKIYNNKNGNGIRVTNGKYNKILNNKIYKNHNHGIYLCKDSSDNEISQNEIFYNSRGVSIKGASNNAFNHNSIKRNSSYGVYLYKANDNLFVGNVLLRNRRNYYYAKFRANNTIKDTDVARVKVYDKESSMTIMDSQNHIFKNTKNLETKAEPEKTSILLTRSITSSVVEFRKLNFEVLPKNGSVYVSPNVWETKRPEYKKWTERTADTTNDSLAVSHKVGDLWPHLYYDVFVGGKLWKTLRANREGYIKFVYSDYTGKKEVFEVKRSKKQIVPILPIKPFSSKPFSLTKKISLTKRK